VHQGFGDLSRIAGNTVYFQEFPLAVSDLSASSTASGATPAKACEPVVNKRAADSEHCGFSFASFS